MPDVVSGLPAPARSPAPLSVVGAFAVGVLLGLVVAALAPLAAAGGQSPPAGDPVSRRLPAMDWEAADIRPGVPIRAAHVGDLRRAHDWLHDRVFRHLNQRHACTGSLAQWVFNFRFLDPENVREDLQAVIRLEDAVREDCGFGLPAMGPPAPR